MSLKLTQLQWVFVTEHLWQQIIMVNESCVHTTKVLCNQTGVPVLFVHVRVSQHFS